MKIELLTVDECRDLFDRQRAGLVLEIFKEVAKQHHLENSSRYIEVMLCASFIGSKMKLRIVPR